MPVSLNRQRPSGRRTQLSSLEEKGWLLTAAVHRIWAGERDGDALTAGLDEQDSALIGHVLELLAAPAEAPRP